MKKRTVAAWSKKIETRQEAVANERDKLDELISELSDLRNSCDEAWDALQDARDALSKFV